MHQYVILNGSPRKDSTSKLLMNMCKESLIQQGHNVTCYSIMSIFQKEMEFLSALKNCDGWIIIGPSYVNTYPGEVIRLLELLMQYKDNFQQQKLYGIIQGGMPYVHTHNSGLRTLSLFAKQCNFIYQGGFVFGLGPVVNGRSLDHLPNAKKIKKGLDYFFVCVMNLAEVDEQVSYQAQLRLPASVTKLLAIVLNYTQHKNFRKKGIDYRRQSPYRKELYENKRSN